MTKTDKHLLLLLSALLIVGVTYWWFATKPDPDVSASTKTTVGWKNFENQKYGLHFLYPPKWEVTEQFHHEVSYTVNNRRVTTVYEPAITVMPPFKNHGIAGGGYLRIDLVKKQESYTQPGMTTQPSPLTVAGRPGTLSIIRAPNGALMMATYRFQTSPPTWGPDAIITMWPLYGKSVEVQKKILDTMTLTTPQ